jgi:nucleotide-binding universal stress UspA family protein
MRPVQTILHPSDFSERSDHAFRFACLLARDLGARLIVLHVMPPAAVAIAGELVAYTAPSDQDKEELWGKLHALGVDDPAVQVEHFLEEGDPASVILRVAETTPCDLIVMGTHGRTGMARLLMGSVAEEVVRKASCPVLTLKVPATQHRSPVEPVLQEAGKA